MQISEIYQASWIIIETDEISEISMTSILNQICLYISVIDGFLEVKIRRWS
jgi:hypothetical protein